MEPLLGEVRTERLVLRHWRQTDLEALVALCAEEEFWRYPFGRGFTRAESERFLGGLHAMWDRRGFGLWAATLTGSGELIGYIGLHPADWLAGFESEVEVGWRLGRDHWGHGYATEGARASLRAGFRDLGLDEVISIFQPENEASGRVMERLGMSPACTARDEQRGDDLLVYKMSSVRFAETEADFPD